jgi:myo-inositol-1-phosphate synthase
MNDAVRILKLERDKGIGGSLVGPSSYLMKSPPKQVPDPVARDLTEEFIAKHARKRVTAEGEKATKAKVKS